MRCSRGELVEALRGRITEHHRFAARSRKTYFHAQFLRLKSRRGAKKAAVAVAEVRKRPR